MGGLVAGGPIEQKAVAAPAATLVAGYLSALLVSAVPWLHDHLTPDQQQSLPIIIAFLLSALAAYLAPHTHRPDLPPQLIPLAEPLPLPPPVLVEETAVEPVGHGGSGQAHAGEGL